MTSKCFYLILHSVLFIVAVFIVQVYCDSDGHYHVQNAQQQDFDTLFIPLDREKRQLPPTEKKTGEPVEDKSKVMKKPISQDAKAMPSTITDSTADKSRIGGSKKEIANVKMASAVTSPQADKDQVKLKPPEGHDETAHAPPVPSSKNLTSAQKTSAVPASNSTAVKVPDAKVSTETPHQDPTAFPNHDIQFTKMFDEKEFKEQLKAHDISITKQDHHLYYNSSFVVDPEMGQKYWVDMYKHKDVKVSDILSQAYRRAMTVKLSFDFPFYGHPIRNITIATGGFLYTGEYVHSWLAATQYIAPLMANFDTTLSNHSFVKYLDNGTAFTVQWENVMLQDKQDKGGFTFQCTLHKNGDIIFVYQQVAEVIEDINDDQHPVRIGLSDAYIIDRTIFFLRRKTIYEYHRVNFQKQDIRNWTVIVLNALDTCVEMKDCHSCLNQTENLRCNWCANRCSNGMDRHRQDWIMNGCDTSKPTTIEECSRELIEVVNNDESVIGVAGIMGILFLVCLGLGIGMWFFYAYRNPHTPAGQFLIRYRPSQWSWKRGEARYTAATIHM